MERVAAVSVGDVAVAAIAGLICVYEAWLFFHRREHREHLWMALVAASCAVFAGCMFLQYNLPPSATVTVNRVAAGCLVLICHTTPLVAFDFTRRRPPFPVWWVYASAVFWLALIATPWVIGDVVEMREMLLLDRPFPRRTDSALATASVLYAMGLVVFGAYWMWKYRAGREREARALLVGVTIWAVAAAHDAIVGLAGVPIPIILLEYGFLALAVALALNDVRKYMDMLRTSERGFRDLLDRSPEAVVALREGRVVYLNETMRLVLGSGPSSDSIGRLASDLIDADDLVDLDTLPPGTPVEATFHCEGDRSVRLEVVAMESELDGEETRVLLARDVSARHRNTARVVQADRLIAMGTLAAGLGHEINNPLAYTLLNLRDADEALRDGGPTLDLDHVREAVSASREGAERMHRIVGALGFFSRRRQTMGVLDLAQVIRSAVEITKNEVRHRARLELELEPRVHVNSSETRLAQVFVNLLVNAAHAIPEGDTASNAVRVTMKAAPERVVCEVSDSGTGIAPEDAQRIFEPFFTTKPAGQGTGLGLGICRDAIRSMGGELTVLSELGVGTTFRLVIPRVAGPRAQQSARVTGDRPALRARLLIVDDEPELLKALSRTLRRDATVVTASSAEEAVRCIEERGPFDLVLSDLMMPDGSGMDLHAAVEARNPEAAARMVFMSGGVFTPEARAFRERINNTFLDKPLDIDELRDRLRDALESRLVDSEAPVAATAS